MSLHFLAGALGALQAAGLTAQLAPGLGAALKAAEMEAAVARLHRDSILLVGGVGHALASVAPRECAVRVADDTRQESAPEQ